MSGLYKTGVLELAVITPRNTSDNVLCLHTKTEVCQLLDSEASLYGVQVNGLASVRWWNPKEDNAVQEDWTGLHYQLLFVLLCVVPRFSLGGGSMCFAELIVSKIKNS
jgi:hypothetical protein